MCIRDRPNTFANLVSTTLYSKRFSPYFVSPIVAGLEKGQPVLTTYDSIGCLTKTEEFVVGGTAAETLYGIAEAFYRPNLNPDELGEIVAQILVSGCDRDILSGWGGVVYVLTEDGLSTKILKTKQT
eukprot:TRINITY_DN183_c0_g1_i7.p3 TRINITY_DN183_c0_g1~~TRINITY_DN183_c0_g1_i7.p3  ORF type:complete len:127 (+),score=35.19 TRINITY_DN183_c0_g1_i7:66-446(+)